MEKRITRRRAGILKVRVFCQDDAQYTVLAGYNFNSCDVLYHGNDLDYAVQVARDYISDSVNTVGCNTESYNQRILLHIDM